jgi:methyl-accepting chemotaxis protein
LIEGSIEKVEIGTRIAKETAAALDKIVEGVSHTTELVADIANASNEQATGIAQINMGISQVSQVTQSNTATAEQSAAASEELSSQAQLLKTMVDKFNLRNRDQLLELNHQPYKMERSALLNRGGVKPGKSQIKLDSPDFEKY